MLLLVVNKARAGSESLVAVIEGANVLVDLSYMSRNAEHENPYDCEHERGVSHCVQIACCTARTRTVSSPCVSPTESLVQSSPHLVVLQMRIVDERLVALRTHEVLLLLCVHFTVRRSVRWVLQRAYSGFHFRWLCGLVV